MITDIFEENSNIYKPQWGYYYNDLFPISDFERWKKRPIFCWLPYYLDMRIYSENDIYVITEWLKENINSIWEGPIGYMGFWKFRFTKDSDIIAFKLYI